MRNIEFPGEAGPATNVKQAVEVLHAQRIGHGYYTDLKLQSLMLAFQWFQY